MKITIEVPDTTRAMFVNYLVEEGNTITLVSKSVGSKDLEAGYKDCSLYEVEK